MIDFEPLKTRRTFEVIVDLIKDRIFSGQYRAGHRLPAEREMAEMLRVGRPAVREAYRALELFGIVDIRKGKDGGAFIRDPGLRPVVQSIHDLMRLRRVSLAELTEARLIIERDVAELAAQRAGPADLARLRASVETALAKTDAGMAASQENVRFHIELAEIAGNPILVMVLTSIMDLLTLFIRAANPHPETSRAVAQDHIRVIEALETRDFNRLWPMLEAHIRVSNARLMEFGGEPSATTGELIAAG